MDGKYTQQIKCKQNKKMRYLDLLLLRYPMLACCRTDIIAAFHLKYQYWNQNVKRDNCRESCKKAISSILESRKIIRRQIKSFLYILKKMTDEFIGHRYYRV